MNAQLRIAFSTVVLVAWFTMGNTSVATETLATAWHAAEVGFGTKPAFDFGPDGRIHVMSMIESVSGGVYYDVADTIDGPWTLGLVSPGYYYGPGDLRVDPSGTAHLGWHNHDLPGPNHLTIDSLGTVTDYPIATPAHSGWDDAIAIDSTGTVHMTSVYPSNFGATDSLEYGTFDGTSWQYSGVPATGPAMYGLATSLAMDSQNYPHAVYNLATGWATPGDLNYAYQDVVGWHVSTVATGGINGRFPSIAIDSLDRPHVAWLDIDPADNTRAFVQYGVLDGGNWNIEQVATLDKVNLGFNGGRKQVSLALDGNDQPHLAFGDQRSVVYATRPNGSWDLTTVLELLPPSADFDLDFYVDEDDLVFWQNGFGINADGDADGDGDTDGDDFLLWQAQSGTVPQFYNGLVVMRLDSGDDPTIVFWQEHATEAGLVRLVSLNAGASLDSVVPEPATAIPWIGLGMAAAGWRRRSLAGPVRISRTD